MTTARGSFTRQADEALGSRQVPLDDAGLEAQVRWPGRAGLGEKRAAELAVRLWTVDEIDKIAPLVEAMAKA